MNILLLGLTTLSLLFFIPPSDTHATVDLGLSIGDEGLNSFYLAVGDYYRVPWAEVAFVRGRHIPYYETPVGFFMAQRAHVAPSAIVDLRLRGMSWMDITLNFGLSPAIYYVPMSQRLQHGGAMITLGRMEKNVRHGAPAGAHGGKLCSCLTVIEKHHPSITGICIAVLQGIRYLIDSFVRSPGLQSLYHDDLLPQIDPIPTDAAVGGLRHVCHIRRLRPNPEC